jgi:hypothetical protein
MNWAATRIRTAPIAHGMRLRTGLRATDAAWDRACPTGFRMKSPSMPAKMRNPVSDHAPISVTRSHWKKQASTVYE